MKKYIRKKPGQPTISLVLTFIILFFLVCMICQPHKFIEKSLDGISAWAFCVLPSVLPFMFFTRVLSSLDVMPRLVKPFSCLSTTLFKTPPISLYAFTMAILSGYPVGSKIVADLYLQRKITREDAFKMSAFCSTSGPMFIVGAVGIGMFQNAKIGYILFASHVLSAILNGILFRNLKSKQPSTENIETSSEQTYNKTETNKSSSFDLADIVLNCTQSILAVGCIITIFFIVIECFSPILNLMPQNLAFLTEGIIEITKGCLSLATLPNKILAISLCSFVISFGGISTLLQSATMLAKLKMPAKLFIIQKVLHGILSCVITILITFLIGV